MFSYLSFFVCPILDSLWTTKVFLIPGLYHFGYAPTATTVKVLSYELISAENSARHEYFGFDDSDGHVIRQMKIIYKIKSSGGIWS